MDAQDPPTTTSLTRRAVEVFRSQAVPGEVRRRIHDELTALAGDLSPTDRRDVEQYLTVVAGIPWAASRTGWHPPRRIRDAVHVEVRRHAGAREAGEAFIDHAALRAFHRRPGVEVVDGHRTGTALLLEGPPGVGKTRLAGRLAAAAGTSFAKIGFGGQSDAPSVRGFSRTYARSGPSQITRALVRAGRRDAVILLDEVDKLGSGTQGNVADALLEVLDGGSEFRDDYLDLPLVLDEVCWIATANDLDRVPEPLLDRFQVVRVDPFTRQEREILVVERLWPDVLTAHGLVPAQQPGRTTTAAERLVLTPGAARLLAAGTGTRDREGLRETERKLARFLARLTAVVPGALERVMAEPLLQPLVLGAGAVGDFMPELKRHLPDEDDGHGMIGGYL